jgi:hypothetical protein
MADVGKKPLTFSEVWIGLRWLPTLFSSAVGSLSLLAMLELLQQYRLNDAFHWIVDGYHGFTKMMALAIEPLLAPAITWINSRLGWHLVLYQHWRPLFLLMIVLLMGFARIEWPKNLDGWGELVIMGIGSLFGALLAGLVPIEGRWWEQGLLAVAPLFSIVMITELIARPMLVLIYIIAMSGSFLPGLGRFSGVVTLAGCVIYIAEDCIVDGFKTQDITLARSGFGILSGFILAGMIVAADWAVKTYG